MVGHKSPGPNVRSGRFGELRHEVDATVTVRFGEKNLLPMVAPLSHMIRVSRNDNTTHPDHGTLLCDSRLVCHGRAL